jgi:hypothetical protein
MKKRELEHIELPADHPGLRAAEERTKPFVRHHGSLAEFGKLDLTALARDCYLQGVWDGAQLAIMRPEVRALWEREPGREASAR